LKLQLVSDLHTEFHRDPYGFVESLAFKPGLDFLLVPGDVAVLKRQSTRTIWNVLCSLSQRARHVLFVTGNHEYYGGGKEACEAVLKAA